MVVTRRLSAPEVLRPLEATLAIFRAVGFDEVMTLGAFRAISSYVDGYALDEITGFSFAAVSDSPGSADGLEIARLDPGEFPRLRQLAPYFAAQDRDAEFAFGLELIIAGLRARLDDHDRAASEPSMSIPCPTSGRRCGHTS